MTIKKNPAAVVPPASATDNAVTRFDGVTGKLVQNSPVIIDDAGAITGVTTINGANIADAITDLTGDVTATGPGSVAAAVAFVGASSAANVHSAELAANAATNLNTASTIVKRDGSGNFSAGAITANLTGNVTGNVSGSAGSFTGVLVGDVTGTQGATVVSTVGTSSAVNVHSAELLANAATNLNTASTIVKRDGSGNFIAGTITANLIGSVTGNVTGNVSGSAGSFTGSLIGDVTGTQGATVVSLVGGSSAANVNTATALVVGNKTANTVLAGPATGAAAAATFRALANADLPANLLGSDVYAVGSNQFYTTIQSALTAFGNAAATADVKKAGTFLIEGGNYDEALTIPQGRIINIIPLGTVNLGDGAGANWASTTPRSVTFTANVADVFASDVKPALNIFPLAGCDTTSTFLMESGCFRISGNLNIAGNGLSHTINLSSTRIDGTVTKTATGLTNLQAYRSYFVGAINAGTSTVLERAYDCQFDSLVTVDSCNMLANCEVKAGMTVNAAVNNLPPSGWFFTTFTGTFTGPAASLKLDPVSDYYFITNGATLAGGATKVLISSIPALNVKYPPTTAGDWSVVPTTDQGALDTLATSGVVKTQTANTLLAGPTSGAVAVPAFRALVAADFNTIASTKLTTDTTANASISPGPTNLTSYTVPASTLAASGNALKVIAFGQCAANTNAKQIIMKLGATTIFDSGSIVLNGDDWMIEAEIIRTGASTQKVIAKFSASANLMAPIVQYTAGAEDLTTALTLKCTGTAATNADITQQGLKVVLEP